MRTTGYLLGAMLAIAALGGAPAAANTCQADGTTCATNMPIDGYCECTVRGVAKGGTVVRASEHRTTQHPRAPDCRVTPQAAGCPGR